ncbi:MAG: TonB-dependent receptor [Desulfarculaceae bacterium]|jgi:outer membrane receptor for ferrienterochelin and colicins
MQIQKTMMALVTAATLTLLPLSVYADAQKSEEKSSKIERVVVTGTKTGHRLEDTPVGTVLITRQDIERSNAKTVSALLNQIPGFNFSQQSDLTGAMGYKNTVRGLNVESRYLLVLVDGQRVFSGYHSGGMASAGFSHNVNVVPVALIERIEVVKGPGSALYGSDAVVGVLNIITRRPPKELQAAAGGGYGQYQVKGNDYLGNKAVDTTRYRYEANALVGGPVTEKVRGIISVSREGNEGIHPTAYDVSRNYVLGRIDIDATDKLKFQAGAEYTAWEAKEDSIGDEKTETAPRLWLSADYRFTPLHKLNLKTYYQQLDADFKDPSYGDSKADVSYTDAELQYTGNFFDSHLVTAGLEYLNESLDTDVVVNREIATKSAYLQDEWSLLDGRLVLVPGIRFDDNEVYGQEWNPKFSAMFKLFTDSTIRASVGRSFKAPTALQTSAEPNNHVVQWVFSNPNLKPEKSITWQVGLEQGFLKRRLVLYATYYNTQLENMITTAPTNRTYQGLPVTSYENLDEASIQGIEATAVLTIIEGLILQLDYAYIDAQNDKTGERLIRTPENSFNAQLTYADKTYRWGGAINLAYTSDQLNMMFAPGASPQTEAFTTVGFNIWKEFLDTVRLSFQMDNLFDEELTGSDTIYVGQSFMLKLDFEF